MVESREAVDRLVEAIALQVLIAPDFMQRMLKQKPLNTYEQCCSKAFSDISLYKLFSSTRPH